MYRQVTLLSLFIICVKAAKEPMVRSNYGPIRGKLMISAKGLDIAAYLGIPYAQPPTGPLRFKSPKPWEQHWVRIRNALEDGPECIQLDDNKRVIGSEDCLTLNIFVPEIPEKRNLTVFIYVHGGSYLHGSKNSTEFGPDYLLDEEIILITVNYRLGIFGFLSSGNEASPGNYGLKDIFQALKWVQANIEDFGGDPSSVTLGGHSSGAALAHHLALSKRTEGLFDKIITHSGTANAPWAMHTMSHAKIRYIALAIQLGCANNRKIIDLDYPFDEWLGEDSIVENDKKIVECLRKANATEIAMMFDFFHVWRNHPYVNFGPTLEPESDDAIITRHPMSLIEAADYRDLPWLGGTVANEGLIKTLPVILDKDEKHSLLSDFDEIASQFLETEEIIANHSVFTDELTEFYFPSDSLMDNDTFETNITAMTGDALVTYWMYEAMYKQSLKQNSSIFKYEFSYEGTFSISFSYDTPRHFGVCHGDDMNYLFPILNNKFAEWDLHNTPNDITMINIMTELWANFMKKGIPSARLTPVWQPYQEDFRFMRLGMGRSPDISMESDFLPTRMQFWYNLMSKVCVPRNELFPENTENTNDNENNNNNTTQPKNATVIANSSQTTSFNIQTILLLLSFHFIF